MEKHVVAVTAVVAHEGSILIVQRHAREVAYPGKWAFPGGKADAGETLEQALTREVLEETGLKVERLAYLRSYTFVRPDGHNVIGACFLARVHDADVSLSGDFESYRWILPEELGQFDHIPGMDEDMVLASKLL